MSNLENEELNLFVVKLYSDEKRKLLNNSDYMDTLVKKIRNNTYVFDGDIKEKTNICSTHNDLSLLYNIIDGYATINNLFPVKQSNYNVYYIKYNNYIFSIFEKQNDEKKPIYGCYDVFLKENQLPYCIDFEDIKNNKKIDIGDFNKGLIAELNAIIDKLYNEGFPIYAIQYIVGKILYQLKKERQTTRNKLLNK